VLLGPNGAGKTRLVAMLRAAIENPDTPQAGIKATQSLVLGYCDQDLAGLADADTPMRAVVRRFDVGDQRARALLAGAGLSIEMQGRPIGKLSGGRVSACCCCGWPSPISISSMSRPTIWISRGRKLWRTN